MLFWSSSSVLKCKGFFAVPGSGTEIKIAHSLLEEKTSHLATAGAQLNGQPRALGSRLWSVSDTELLHRV